MALRHKVGVGVGVAAWHCEGWEDSVRLTEGLGEELGQGEADTLGRAEKETLGVGVRVAARVPCAEAVEEAEMLLVQEVPATVTAARPRVGQCWGQGQGVGFTVPL